MDALASCVGSIRWTCSLAYVVVTTPTALVVWSASKLVSFVLPQRLKSTGDELFYESYQRMLLLLFEELTGVRIYFHGYLPKKCSQKENAIVLFNHQCTSDWMLASSLGVRMGSVGIVRYILKDALKRIPFYGFYLQQHGCIYISREKFVEDQMTRQLSQYSQDKKWWMVIFPEGTRYNPDASSVLSRNKEYAIANGFPAFSHVLTPRSKGLEMCLKTLGDRTEHLFDVTIAYGGTSAVDGSQRTRLKSPTLLELLKGRCKEIHVYTEKIPMTDVPTDKVQLKTWLFERFRLKDDLLKQFYSPAQTNMVDKSGQLVPLGLSSTLPSFTFYLTANALLLSNSTGRKVYLASVILGSLTCLSTIIFKI